MNSLNRIFEEVLKESQKIKLYRAQYGDYRKDTNRPLYMSPEISGDLKDYAENYVEGEETDIKLKRLLTFELDPKIFYDTRKDQLGLYKDVDTLNRNQLTVGLRGEKVKTNPIVKKLKKLGYEGITGYDMMFDFIEFVKFEADVDPIKVDNPWLKTQINEPKIIIRTIKRIKNEHPDFNIRKNLNYFYNFYNTRHSIEWEAKLVKVLNKYEFILGKEFNIFYNLFLKVSGHAKEGWFEYVDWDNFFDLFGEYL